MGALTGTGVRILLIGTGQHTAGSELPDLPTVSTTVTDLAGLAPRWDKLIAADLVREVENDTAERVVDKSVIVKAVVHGTDKTFTKASTCDAGESTRQ